MNKKFTIQKTWKLKNRICFFVALMVVWSLTSCVTVQPYQRAFLEDKDMKFKYSTTEVFEQDAQGYREGAAGGGIGKSSGGCGCN